MLKKYILGELSDLDREALELQYFVNQRVWEALQQVEEDLIDSYVRGRLDGHDRQQFENYFLASPQKRKRVEVARLLMDSARGAAASQSICKP